MRVQAGGEEPIRSRGYSQPAAEGDELRGRAATHHERLQVCEDMLEIEDTTVNIGSCIPKALHSLCFFFCRELSPNVMVRYFSALLVRGTFNRNFPTRTGAMT